MTRGYLKTLIHEERWEEIGSTFNFTPSFITGPSGKKLFDWASCPPAMSNVLRNGQKSQPHRQQPKSKPKAVRHRSYIEQGALCFYCANLTDFDKWTIDHKLPLCRGGRGGVNCVGCCSTCNTAKGSMTFEEFLQTDYLPQHCRTALGYRTAPTVKFKIAKCSHQERVKRR